MTEKILVYPADEWACGAYRMRWPAAAAAAESDDYDIEIVEPGQRDFRAKLDERDNVREVVVPEGTAAVVFQRPTHKHLAQAVPLMRAAGLAVIVDMDDDLKTIHPGNVAHHIMHPKHGDPAHSWEHAAMACRAATVVTTSTPALQERYAPRGNGVVLPNYVPGRYLDVPHEDSDVITWCGSLHSHPDDLRVVGGSIANLVRAGGRYRSIGQEDGVGRTLGLSSVEATGVVMLDDWPTQVATSGVTVAPLNDTKFNAAKSWLKPLEAMSLGVPVVMSPRAEYDRLHRLTGFGFLAGKPRHWEQRLRQLVGSPELRAEQSAGARQFVRENLTIELQAWRWADAWSEAIDRQRGRVKEISA